jgi:hypothetical protein
MRPTFAVPVDGDGREVMERLVHGLHGDAPRFTGQVLKRHAFLQLPRGERSFLSPYLNLQLREDEDGTTLCGRFSPHPGVWTGFMLVYGVLGMLALTGLMYGWAQTTVDEYPWGFWVVPACAALGAFVYGAAVIGQGLTASEMHDMRSFVEVAAGAAPEVGADPGESLPAAEAD